MGFHVDLPSDLTSSDFDLKMIFASKLFDEGLITSGQGAKIVGINRRSFIELLGRYGVSAFQTDEDELLEDVANA
jgi:predicted HTH domain antitoxin